MTLFARLRSWFSAVLHRSHLEDRIDDELRFHIESYAADLIRGGVPEAEALRRARVEFGGMESHKSDIRKSLGLRVWDELWIDVLYAFRMLRKSPGFTFIAVLSLALGIGANTVIFTLAKEVLLETLHVPHASDLRMLSMVIGENGVIHRFWGDFGRDPNGQTRTTSFSYPAYLQLRARNHSLDDLFAFKDVSRLNATIDGNAQMLSGELVSGNYYQQLGVTPVLGRAVIPADDAAPGAGPVALISDSFWERRFGRSPAAIGKTIYLNTVPITIIGVNPSHFTGAVNAQMSPDVFLPISMQPAVLPRSTGSLLADTDLWWVLVMGRVHPGITEESARAALDLSLAQAIHSTMTSKPGESMPHLSLSDGSRGLNFAGRQYAHPTYVLIALTGLVLLLACANLANLSLARSISRQREISVRLALGASRGRILRQLLTESLLLSSLGGAAGLLLAYLGRNLLPHLLATSWEPPPFTPTFDLRIIGYTAAISILTGLLFGLAPAFQATRTNVNKNLKDSAATATNRPKNSAGKALVVFQVALSLLLIIAAGLFSRTFINLGSTDIGFNPKNLLLFSIDPPHSRYPSAKDIALVHELEERFAAVPGVASVTLSEEALLANSISREDFAPDGVNIPEKQQVADDNWVGEKFFSTMGIPILAGRGFASSDTETSAKVAVINRSLAKQFFGDADPIGRTFDKGKVQIVGICADAKFTDLRNDPPPTYYRPFRQTDQAGGITFEIRTAGDPIGIVGDVRNVVRSLDKDLPVADVRTQSEQIAATLSQERIFAALTSAFGALALVLSAIGIYGIMAYTVSRRTNEIGLRMALGAQTRQMLRMVLSETSQLAWIGIGVGLVAAIGLTRFVTSLFYGLKATDPLTLGSAAALLFAIALLAAWVPAHRAASIQPMQALRHE